MQRRAAAGYVVLFLVFAAGAYVLVSVTSAPAVTVENPDHELSAGDELTVEGRTYVVERIEATEEEGEDHGGGTDVVYEATLAWTNESGRYVETLEAEDTVDFSGLEFLGQRLNGSYTVVVPNVTDPTNATLRAVPENRSTREIDGVTYVETRNEDGSLELVPIDQYEELQRVTVEEGTVDYRGNSTEVSITSEGVTLTWTAPKTQTVDLGQAQNVTLNGRQFFAYFPSPSGETVYLTSDPSSYFESVERADRYNERRNGLWGITILGLVAATLLTALAFLPRKDT